MNKEDNMEREKAVMALGMFDGVHQGHREILHNASILAEQKAAKPIAFTFLNHPRTIFGENPFLLTTPAEKKERIQRMGVAPVLVAFDRKMADQSPEDFLQMLMQQYEIKGIAIGDDYRFGKDAVGDRDCLASFCDQHDIVLSVGQEVWYQGQRVSSSRIREEIHAGNMQDANTMLVDNYEFIGIVSTHAQLGRNIGFPTANLDPMNKIIPKHGVYISRVHAKNETYAAVTNIGTRPTVEKNGEVIIEAHILNASIDLYNQPIRVEIIQFLRPEVQFHSLDELKQAIAQDCEQTLQFFEKE